MEKVLQVERKRKSVCVLGVGWVHAHSIGKNVSGRGHEDYTSIEKAETDLYEVQKRAKLALVIVERSNWRGTPGNFMRQWNCSVSGQGIRWVWIFFKTHIRIYS